MSNMDFQFDTDQAQINSVDGKNVTHKMKK